MVDVGVAHVMWVGLQKILYMIKLSATCYSWQTSRTCFSLITFWGNFQSRDISLEGRFGMLKTMKSHYHHRVSVTE